MRCLAWVTRLSGRVGLHGFHANCNQPILHLASSVSYTTTCLAESAAVAVTHISNSSIRLHLFGQLHHTTTDCCFFIACKVTITIQRCSVTYSGLALVVPRAGISSRAFRSMHLLRSRLPGYLLWLPYAAVLLQLLPGVRSVP